MKYASTALVSLLLLQTTWAQSHRVINDFETGTQGWGATIYDQTQLSLSEETPPGGGTYSLLIEIDDPPADTGGARRGWSKERAIDLSGHHTLSFWVNTTKPNNTVYLALRDTLGRLQQYRVDDQIDQAATWTKVRIPVDFFDGLDLTAINHMQYKWSTGYPNEVRWEQGDRTFIDSIELDAAWASSTTKDAVDDDASSAKGIQEVVIDRDARPIRIEVRARGDITIQEIADHVQDPQLLRIHRNSIQQYASLFIGPADEGDTVRLVVQGRPYDAWWRLHSEADAPVKIELDGALHMVDMRMTGWQGSSWDRTEPDGRAHLVVYNGPVYLDQCRFDHLGHTYAQEANGVTFIDCEVDIRASRFHDMYLTLFRNCRGTVQDTVFSSHHQYVRLQGCEDMQFARCTFQASHRSGLQLEHPGCHRILITDSVFRDNERFGLYIYQDDTDNRVENSLFERNNIGVVIERSAHFNAVVNCRFLDHDTRAVLIANDCNDNIVAGNYIDGCNWHAIAIDDHAEWGLCQRNVIMGNVIKNSPVGINLADDTRHTLVQGNRIENADRFAVWLTRGARDNVFKDNVITPHSVMEIMHSPDNVFAWHGQPASLRWSLLQSSAELKQADEMLRVSAEEERQSLTWPVSEGENQ